MPKEEALSFHPQSPIRGWLALFVLILIVVVPAAALLRVAFEIGLVGGGGGGLSPVEMPGVAVRIGLAALSVLAGSSLLRRKPNAVRLAKATLWAFLIAALIPAGWAWVQGPPDVDTAAFQAWEPLRRMASAGVFFGVWYVYLLRSRRVRGTFPESG